MKRSLLALALPVMLLAGCQPGGDPQKAAAEHLAEVSRADPRIPAGFKLYIGSDGAHDFSIHDAGRGKIATWAVTDRPHDVTRYYEDEAVAAGFEVIGRVDAGDLTSLDVRTKDADAAHRHTMSVMAADKGEFTNITLMYDVTR